MTKITVESCTSIFIAKLQKAIRKIINRDYPESPEDKILELTGIELRKFSVNNQSFEYTQMKNKMGGYRWFFLCPKCKKRVGKLFLPPEGCGKENKYYCKNCHHLRNQSSLLGQNKIYKNVTRHLKKMKSIEDKINRGYLSGDKVQELLNEYDKLEKMITSVPEYRIYMFKKTHGMIP